MTQAARDQAGVQDDVGVEAGHIEVADLQLLGGDPVLLPIVLGVQAADAHLIAPFADHDRRLKEGWQFDGAVARVQLEHQALGPFQHIHHDGVARLDELGRGVAHAARHIHGAADAKHLRQDCFRHLGVGLAAQIDQIDLAHLLAQLKRRFQLPEQMLRGNQVTVQAVVLDHRTIRRGEVGVVGERQVRDGFQAHPGGVQLEVDHHPRCHLDQVDVVDLQGFQLEVPIGHPGRLLLLDDGVGHALHFGKRAPTHDGGQDRRVELEPVEGDPQVALVAHQGDQLRDGGGIVAFKRDRAAGGQVPGAEEKEDVVALSHEFEIEDDGFLVADHSLTRDKSAAQAPPGDGQGQAGVGVRGRRPVPEKYGVHSLTP
ncbi:MAG: hypothetical protein IPL15_10405 [Comamonadaceae bacterium]|uniref:hypothetical protein n=1 Tax=Candidatus Skiveiella danica TaxID=3386177 RepID=UPI00390ACA85|nr:hypothetical protein [Comamonadaceae bacterium]